MRFPLHDVSFAFLLFHTASNRRTRAKSVFKEFLALILRSFYCATYIMLSNASLAGVLVCSVIGTAVVVITLGLLWTRVQRRSVTIVQSRRTHDADLKTAPYDLESLLLDTETGNDNNIKIELIAMFNKMEDCINKHFPKGKARSSQHDPEIEMQLENTVVVLGQLDVKSFISLLSDSQHRRHAAKHFIASSICAALDIRNHDESKSLVQQDYMSFVKSIKTYTPQCM